MKRISLLCLAAVLLLFLTACGTPEQPKEPEVPASSESEASSQIEATEPSSKSNDSKPNTEPERDAGEGSNKTSEKNSEPDDNKEFSIKAYSAAIEDAKNYFDECAADEDCTKEDFSYLGDLGYALYDLDGTGAPELLIGFNDDQDIFVQESILLIYTLENNQPKRLFESWIPVAAGYYNRLMLHEGNIICHSIGEETSGASNDYYRVSNGSAQLIEACADISDEDYPYDLPATYVYSTSFADAFNNQDKFDIVDQVTVERTIAKYGDPIPIDYTPLTELN